MLTQVVLVFEGANGAVYTVLGEVIRKEVRGGLHTKSSSLQRLWQIPSTGLASQLTCTPWLAPGPPASGYRSSQASHHGLHRGT
jgi:hypothetical protein